MRRHVEWPFPDGRFPDELGAVIQRTVLAGERPALLVVHDDEGDWLVGDGANDPNLPGASVAAHISHAIRQNSSIAELADLPLGWSARRVGPGAAWERSAHVYEPDDDSVLGGALRLSGADSLRDLPRRWWFPPIAGLRASARASTYEPWDLDRQPRLAVQQGALDWLENDQEKTEWAIDQADGEGQQCRLGTDELLAISNGLPLPLTLEVLAARPDLQRRIRSATGSYLDLGDFSMATSGGGSRLIHLLSDQQSCRHWLLYTDDAGRGPVLTSAAPLGIDWPEWWEPHMGTPPSNTVPLDGSFDLDVCADSFAEFLYRYWVENELYFAVSDGSRLTGRVAEYAKQLSATAQS